MEFFNGIFVSLVSAGAAVLSAMVVSGALLRAAKRSAKAFSLRTGGGKELFKSALVFLFSAIAFSGSYLTRAEKRGMGIGEWGMGIKETRQFPPVGRDDPIAPPVGTQSVGNVAKLGMA